MPQMDWAIEMCSSGFEKIYFFVSLILIVFLCSLHLFLKYTIYGHVIISRCGLTAGIAYFNSNGCESCDTYTSLVTDWLRCLKCELAFGRDSWSILWWRLLKRYHMDQTLTLLSLRIFYWMTDGCVFCFQKRISSIWQTESFNCFNPKHQFGLLIMLLWDPW